MVEWFQETAGSGSLLLAVPVAVVAGLVSFFSPCVLPLLPGYLSYATGLSGADLASGEADRRRGRMFLGSVLFVSGFAAVFVLMGTATGALGRFLIDQQRAISIVLGALVIVLGLFFAGVLKLSWLSRDYRVHAVPAVGLGAAPLLGVLFGIGWMPCTGPTLSVIATLTLQEATAARGALLSGFYALGLGVPFILAGLFYRRALGALQVVRRHQVWVSRIGGGMLVLVGLLLVTGLWNELITWLQVHLILGRELAL